MEVLVTGGAGYIGSHTVVELLQDGHDVTIVDNLSNSSEEAVKRVETITGKKAPLHVFDVRDASKLEALFAQNNFDAVIHFAGLKSVGESVEMPLAYYRNNIDSTLSLCEVMQHFSPKRLVFSSSATVYGLPEKLPLNEDSQTGVGITNPYGQTKFMIEQILKDLVIADPEWSVSILRYFNPVGAHESGLIGEDPKGIPNNLLPYISQVAVGKLGKLQIFGNDYHTPDGTGIRDYIHVVDLAKGHVAALQHNAPGLEVYNLGTGRGVSVLEMVRAFEKVSNLKIPFEYVDRRPGDVAECYADVSKAQSELSWVANKTIEQACGDAWRWQSQNPKGFEA